MYMYTLDMHIDILTYFVHVHIVMDIDMYVGVEIWTWKCQCRIYKHTGIRTFRYLVSQVLEWKHIYSGGTTPVSNESKLSGI
jgi:hypothetical protein